MTPKIFISHSPLDKNIVHRVISYLESNGQRCWVTPRDVPDNTDPADAIIDAIDSASWMILVLSEHSNSSPQVRRELERAVSKGITIIPLIIETVELAKWMQYYISAHQWFDVTNVSLEKKLSELLNLFEADRDVSTDLSDLSSLADDLDKLSLALDTTEEETAHLLPGEKRKVTVLSIHTGLSKSDLPGSARQSISKTIDNLVDRYLKAYSGYLDSRNKETYRCVFGLEHAREDDTRRAICCGIRLFNGFSELNSVLRQKNFTVNFGLGIASGTIEVEQTGKGHPESSGEPFDTAEMLSKTASNELLSTKSVYKVCKDQFIWEKHSKNVYRIEDYSIAGPETKTLSIRSIFVGRDKELSILKELLKRQKQGTDKNRRDKAKHLVLGIRGEAGIGKSRLVHEFTEKNCQSEEILVLKGQSLSYAQPPYWLWTTLLRNLLNIELGSSISYDQFLTRLSKISSEQKLIRSAPFLAELLSIKTCDKRLELLDNKAIALEKKISMRTLLQALSTSKQLVVILEDLHWIDSTDKEMLEFVVGNCDTDMPVAFLLLYRPERKDGSRVEFKIHPNYAEREEIQIVEVDDTACSTLAQELLKAISETSIGKIAPDAEQFLLDHSRGNPFYLEELVLDLVESKTLASQENEWKFTKSLKEIFVPESLTGLLQSRLDRLPETWKDLLQFSSVLGMEFQLKLLNMLTERISITGNVTTGLNGLERKQMLLCERSAFANKYLFRHILVHDTAYSNILEENLQKLHKAAAESIEELFTGNKEEISGILCYHYENAAVIPKAIEWGMKALKNAVKNYSNEEALNLSDKLENWLNDNPETVKEIEDLFELLKQKEQVLNLLGRRKEQERVIEKMIVIAEESKTLKWMAESYNRKGNFSRITGHPEQARNLYEKALDLHRETGNRKGEGIILGNLGLLQENLGHMGKAQEFYEKALKILQKVGDRRSKGTIFGNLGSLFYQQGRMNEARELYTKAIQIARETDDRIGEGGILGNLGALHSNLGHMDKAQELYEKALLIHIEIGNHLAEGHVYANIGALHHQLGNLDEAHELLNKALEIHREVGHSRYEAINLTSLGCLLFDQDRMEKASEHFKKALEIARDADFFALEGNLFGNLGEIRRKQGRIDEAHELYSKALEVARKVGNLELEGHLLGNIGETNREQGQTEAAQECFQKALKIHREVGDCDGEGICLGNLGLLNFEKGQYEKALENYHLAYKIISDAKFGKDDFDGFIELHGKLISSGYSKDEVPWPIHWDIPEDSADESGTES